MVVDAPKHFLKLVMITGGSAVFGGVIALFMSSFEFNSSLNVDVDRSTRSQMKQHFFGFGRHLKRQSLHFAKFGMFIGLIELPIELIVGRVNAGGIFISGGGAAMMMARYTGVANAVTTFMGSGLFIGGLGLFMHKGQDKS